MVVLDFTPMRTAQEEHMLDLCDLTKYTITYDDYGAEIKTPVVTSGVKCGFSYSRTWDKDNGAWLSTGNKAALRLPIGTSIDDVTDVTIVGGVSASGVWNLDGEPQISNTCIILDLTRGVT
jgi:hypothetical protein